MEKFDEEEFAVEQKRKLRWESFRDQHNIPSRNLAQKMEAQRRYATSNLEHDNNFAKSPITHKALDIYSSTGIAGKEI